MQNDWVGRVIDGRFALAKWVGSSSHSTVYLTSLPGSSQKAAIKLIPVEAGVLDPLANFNLRAELSHPHLIRVFDSGSTVIDGAKFVYVVSEYADEILAELLPNRAMTTDEVKDLIPPVLDALGYLHSQRLVHSRLKPSNILVVNDKLKLSTDCVREASESVHDRSPLAIYDAPERARGVLTRSCDLWSFGIILVEAFTQKTPEWNRAGNGSPHVPESIPQPYRKVAEICLRIDPGERATINDVKRNLGMPVVQPKPQVVRLSASQSEVPRLRSIERNFSQKPRAGKVALVLLAMIAIAALLWLRAGGNLPSLPSRATQSNNQPAQKPPENQPETSAPQSSPDTPAPAARSAPPAKEQQQEQPPATNPEAPNPATPAPSRSMGGGGNSVGFVTRRVMPNVLSSASRTIHGTINVFVRVNVSPSGDVSYASFQSEGPSRYFARIAMDAARQWKFKPAMSGGRPVASAWSIHFMFTRDRVQANPTPAGL